MYQFQGSIKPPWRYTRCDVRIFFFHFKLSITLSHSSLATNSHIAENVDAANWAFPQDHLYCLFSGNFPFLSEIPENLDPTKVVDPNSFISLMCNSTQAKLISDSLKDELVAAVFVSVPKLVPNLKGGYFAKSDSKDMDELCFEPKDMLTMAQLAQLYSNFRSAKSMPFFTVPDDNEHVKGVKVNLREDKTLNGGKSVRRNN